MFAALLGDADNGHWSISPTDPAPRVSRHYLGNTLILETEFETVEGGVSLIDFMPLRSRGMTSDLVRIVRGRHGHVQMNTEFVLRFDYGSVVPWITRLDEHSLQAIAGPDMVMLYADAALTADGYRHRGTFTVAAGENVAFSLRYGRSYASPPGAIDPVASLKATEAAWKKWSGACRTEGSMLR